MLFLKKIATFTFVLLSQFVQAQQSANTFNLKGNYKGADGDKIYLAYNLNGKQLKDSSVVKAGSFMFQGNISEPTIAYLYASPPSAGKSITVFLEPTQMQIAMDGSNWKTASITGSVAQKELDLYNNGSKAIQKEMEPLIARYDSANKAYMKAMKSNTLSEEELTAMKYRTAAIHDEFDPYHDRIGKINQQFFKDHPTSMVTAFNLRFYTSGLPADSLQVYYNNLGPVTQQTNYGKELADELAKIKSGSPGSIAKNFATTDILGNQFSLVGLKGKYVLLDFWASWCVPCRKGNPHLKELYAQYKPKGFEVVGVSDDDRDNAAWKKAVEKDGLPWLQVLRGMKYDPVKGYDRTNDINEGFGIHTLPTQILIDPNGKIIGRYGGGGEEHENLDKKLATLLSKS